MAIDRFSDTAGRGGEFLPPRRSFGPSNGNQPPQQPVHPGRIPPHSIEAEMSVLGAMMLGDRAAIERATEILTRDDFYRDAHAHLFDGMVALTEKDEPVDIVTLQDELQRKGILEQVGGLGYLMQLGDFEFTTSNIAYYAKIVQEKAILRRLIEAASQIAGLAYGQVDEVTELVDKAERTIFEVARRRDSQGFSPLRPLLNEAFDRISDSYHERGMVSGVDTGYEQLNYITSGLQDGDLIIIAARPSMGKTSLVLGIGQNACLRAGKTVAVFSLEMSKESLVQRMICSEARIDAHRLRTGYLDDSDWGKISEAVNRLWDTNLFIDDSTDMSALEMRAKCRRLRAEHGLDLVIVDYLQLMRGQGKGESNRNEEITTISRGLKNLAREMKVPVIALSQLSRSVERREDKRPMLSDLRECLTGDARLYDARTGKPVPIKNIQPGDHVLAVSAAQKVVAAEVTAVWQKGIKPVFRLTTETGRVLECTDNHPLLTQNGYKSLANLCEGDLLATPFRLTPPSATERPERADLCRFLGYMVGDGHYGKHRTISFISADREVYDEAKAIVAAHFPAITFHEEITGGRQTCWEVDFVFHHKDGRHGKPFGNPVINYLREIGILGQRCWDKRVPDFVFEAGILGAREYLAGYLATDGCVKRRKSGKYQIHFDTVSHDLARDVQHLLTRLGVVATIQEPQRTDGIYRPIYRINVNPLDRNLRQFARQVCPPGRKGVALQQLLEEPIAQETNPGVFALPPSVSALLFERTKDRRQQGVKLPAGKSRLYWKDQGKRLRRDSCRRWAETLNDSCLAEWAESDLLWERVRSIEPVGEKETFDICVPATGNFIAEGMVVHNSGAIEAEADIVAFIYRPAYYERKEAISQQDDNEKAEREKQGGASYDGEEAEIIIAKQRNGPTGTIKLAFLPKYARFDNLDTQHGESPF